MKAVETAGPTNYLTPLELCPRIIVFRPFVYQLPKLDVAGSTPVARSFVSPSAAHLRGRRSRTLLGGALAPSSQQELVVSSSCVGAPDSYTVSSNRRASSGYRSIMKNAAFAWSKYLPKSDRSPDGRFR